MARRPVTRVTSNGYGDDLAYIHDVGFGSFAETAAPFLLKCIAQVQRPGETVVDLGCGSGIGARRLADAGYRVLGIDQSPAMIAIARKRVPEGQFHVGSFVDAELPPSIAVTAIGECFSYSFDPANTGDRLGALFERVHDCLEPGGCFIFDVVARGRVPGIGPQRSFREGPDWAVLVEAEEINRRRELVRRITSFRKVGELYRRAHEEHRLTLYRPEEVTRALRRIGFRVRRLAAYGALRLPRGNIGFLARKM